MTICDYDSIRAVEWTEGAVKLLDQRLLPRRHEYLECVDAASVAQAITDMVVRGAPVIGISAAYAVVLAARTRYADSPTRWKQDIEDDIERLAAARPTAVNLFWALARMRRIIIDIVGDPRAILLDEARQIHAQDIAANHLMGELGAAILEVGSGVLTHCNTGSLATGGYGTALGVIRCAYANGKIARVFADETRPWLQGSRLTAWELMQDGIPVTLIADAAAAYLMQQGTIQWVVVGADRIAANGDVANKIGTYSLAVAARHHDVKFMVVAPTSSIDSTLDTGLAIPIEVRSAQEILFLGDQDIAASTTTAWNPAFDITPAKLIDVLVTEKGVIYAPCREKITAMIQA